MCCPAEIPKIIFLSSSSPTCACWWRMINTSLTVGEPGLPLTSFTRGRRVVVTGPAESRPTAPDHDFCRIHNTQNVTRLPSIREDSRESFYQGQVYAYVAPKDSIIQSSSAFLRHAAEGSPVERRIWSMYSSQCCRWWTWPQLSTWIDSNWAHFFTSASLRSKVIHWCDILRFTQGLWCCKSWPVSSQTINVWLLLVSIIEVQKLPVHSGKDFLNTDLEQAIQISLLNFPLTLGSKKSKKYAPDLLQKEKGAFKISSFSYTLLW